MDKYKDCPFCGGKPFSSVSGYVNCSNCSAGAGTWIEWNTRHTTEPKKLDGKECEWLGSIIKSYCANKLQVDLTTCGSEKLAERILSEDRLNSGARERKVDVGKLEDIIDKVTHNQLENQERNEIAKAICEYFSMKPKVVSIEEIERIIDGQDNGDIWSLSRIKKCAEVIHKEIYG